LTEKAPRPGRLKDHGDTFLEVKSIKGMGGGPDRPGGLQDQPFGVVDPGMAAGLRGGGLQSILVGEELADQF
jgi:hypothetical protein